MTSPTLLVELLDHRGGVRSRVRLDRFPATIGRAYNNDVILDDPYVSPLHVRVVLDGEQGVNGSTSLIAQDAESLNGIREVRNVSRRAASVPRVSSVAIRPGTMLRIGSSVLRFHDPEQPVSQAIADRAHVSVISGHLDSIRVCLAVFIAAGLTFALEAYLGSYERTDAARIAGGALGPTLILVAWSSVWALVNRITAHRFRFFTHLALVSIAGLASLLVDSLNERLVFMFPASQAANAMSGLGYAAIIVPLLYGHLSLVSALARRRLLASAFVTACVIFGLVALVEYSVDEELGFRGEIEYPTVLKMGDAGWLPAISLDEFSAVAATLKVEVDELKED